MAKANELPGIYSEYSIYGVGDHNSVSSGADNGANNCMSSKFWNCMRHGSTQQAMDNYLSRMPSVTKKKKNTKQGAGNLNLGGHGSEGAVETGTGQTGAWDPGKWIVTWNQYAWGPQLDRVKTKNFPMFSIYSCHTGAGAAGADLLYQMAVVLQRAVRARTGFTYCSSSKGVTFEPGSVWQVATPVARPTPIEAPTPHYVVPDLMQKTPPNFPGRIDLAKILTVTVQHTQAVGGRSVTVTLKGAEAVSFVRACFASEPFTIPGDPTAFITLTVEIDVAKAKGMEQRKFIVYNDRMIQDVQTKECFYTSPAIKEFSTFIGNG